MKILIAPFEVSGYGQRLQAGFRELGLVCDVGNIADHRHKYPGVSLDGFLWRLQRGLVARRSRLGPRFVQIPRNVLLSGLSYMVRTLIFLTVFPRYDAFVFLYGQTFTNSSLELRLLKLSGKKVITVFMGSDARPPYLDGSILTLQISDVVRARKLRRTDLAVRRRVARHERWADHMIMAAPIAQYATSRFVNWFAIGIPSTLALEPSCDEGSPSRATAVEMPASFNAQRPIRLLHAPSNTAMKGTDRIRDMVASLEAKGFPIEYRELSGRPHAEVIAALSACDLVLDQCYSDTPLAGLATEAAFCARPSLVGSYNATSYGAFLGQAEMPPSFFVQPDAMPSKLQELIQKPQDLAQVGLAAQSYVMRQWGSRVVAERFLRLLNNDVPQEWFCNPKDTLWDRVTAANEEGNERWRNAYLALRTEAGS